MNEGPNPPRPYPVDPQQYPLSGPSKGRVYAPDLDEQECCYTDAAVFISFGMLLFATVAMAACVAIAVYSAIVCGYALLVRL